MLLAFFFAGLLSSNAKPLEHHLPGRAVQMHAETLWVCLFTQVRQIWMQTYVAASPRSGTQRKEEAKPRTGEGLNPPECFLSPMNTTYDLLDFIYQPVHFFSKYFLSVWKGKGRIWKRYSKIVNEEQAYFHCQQGVRMDIKIYCCNWIFSRNNVDTKEGMLSSVQVGQRMFDQETVSGFLQNENLLSREMSRNTFSLFVVLLSLFDTINHEGCPT